MENAMTELSEEQANRTELELKRKYEGKWIVLLSDGSYFVGSTPNEALSNVKEAKTIKEIFRSPMKDELLLYLHFSNDEK
jgi:hypothetical protein